MNPPLSAGALSLLKLLAAHEKQGGGYLEGLNQQHINELMAHKFLVINLTNEGRKVADS